MTPQSPPPLLRRDPLALQITHSAIVTVFSQCILLQGVKGPPGPPGEPGPKGPDVSKQTSY